MHKRIIFYFTLLSGLLLFASEKGNEQNKKTSPQSAAAKKSITDRAVGYMDAGKMKINGVENFGLLCGYDHPGSQTWYPGAFHGNWGEIRWIAPVISMPPGPWGAQNNQGPPLPDDRSAQYNSIESFSAIHLSQGDGSNFTDWEAKDNSRLYYQGDLLRDNIRYVATSTLPESWPEYYFDEDLNKWINTPGENHWPGNWAVNPDPDSPDFGKPMPGQFTSSQDIFFISDDKNNGVRETATTARYGYPVGLDMEVTGYSYASTIYENIVFFNVNFIYRTADEIQNPESKYYDPKRHYYDGTIDSVYFSFFIDPDLPGRYLKDGSNSAQASPWAEDDYGLIYDYDFDGSIDVFLAFDKQDYFTDQTYPQNSDAVSAYGINFFKTPLADPSNPNSSELGITSFHWFDQDEAMRPHPVNESWEKTLYALSAGKPELLPETERPKWFHGGDPKFDDINLLKDYQESFPIGERPDIQFYFTSGPFSISPGDTIPIHLGIVGGTANPGALDAEGFPTNSPDIRFAEIFKNLSSADSLYKNNFIGFRPPEAPVLNAAGTLGIDKNNVPVVYGQGGKVSLYWDTAAEESYEILLRKFDFQGYRVYKTVADLSGSTEPTWGEPIYQGTNLVGYVPIVQYDVDDEWSGDDPYNPYISLGTNSGLKHAFTDYDVVDGVRYRYVITAYDDPIVEFEQPSLESYRGNNPRLVQTVDVIPGEQPQGFVPGTADSVVSHLSGSATGIINLKVIDPFKITGDIYELTFSDTTDQPEFTIKNLTRDEVVIENSSYSIKEEDMEKEDYRPIFDGIGIQVINHNKLEQLHQGWIKTMEDASEYDFSMLTPVGSGSGLPNDYEIVFVDSIEGTKKYDRAPYENSQRVPFKVFNISKDPGLNFPLRIFVRNPLLPWTSGDFVYLLEGDPNLPLETRTWQFSISWQTDAAKPKTGDIYGYSSKKRFKLDDIYHLQPKPSIVQEEYLQVEKIKVVPNPYIVYNVSEHLYNDGTTDRKIRFINLPSKCTIKVYTLTGSLIKRIDHESNSIGEAVWNLITDEQLAVSYGVYIYTAVTPSGARKIGKFAVIK